ncbi:Ferredoxin [Desulfosporosinus sp. I2]|uniref:ATP-binding protein n=1 Tax=Desulfosporosinus sp. I2 TaxID=1617025 RepID=UPI0005EE5299|nr:4Fe-4S dicluster domain-containing protein [Desulfosporosinus sp. I2]KJR49337.1 Ferredoxin [Desulfosporosinus sp. I2]
MSMVEKFVVLFSVPDFVVPYLSCFVSESQMDLVVRLDGQRCSVSDVAKSMGCDLEQAGVLLEDCYYKSIVNREVRDEGFVYFGADFYGRLDFLCKFDESYKVNLKRCTDSGENKNRVNKDQKAEDDIGDRLLKALDDWCYQVYAEGMGPYLEQLKNNEVVDRAPETFLLIEDLEELLNSVSEIRMVPCNCRKLAERCSKPTETCLSFDGSITDRTFGRPLSKDEAREIVKVAHRNGLMHQINSDWREKGPAWLCNCCSCCCYPTRLAQERGMKGIFPVSNQVALRDDVLCLHCGVCTKRCNFSAFYVGDTEMEMNGKLRKMIQFDQDKCWGCGICVDSCVAKAISMTRRV